MLATLKVFAAQPIAHAILVLATVAVVGLALGAVRYRGIALGSAGVLFAGIVFGHFGGRIDHSILDFVKDFGLVLFVFNIGLQLGPGFVAALRQQGLKLNLLALGVVLGGAICAGVGAKLFRVDSAAVLGVFSGATSNTPSLGAAQQALATLPGFPADRSELPALAYAVSYPIGTIGIFGSMLVLRAIFRIDPVREGQLFAAEQQRGVEPLERVNVVIENRRLEGVLLGQIPGLRETGVTISRVRRAGEVEVQKAALSIALRAGDVLLAVGTPLGLKQFTALVGRVSDHDLMTSPGKVKSRQIVVTRNAALGKTIAELSLRQRYGVTVTRVRRGGLELTVTPGLRLRFGDVLQIVGEDEGLDEVADIAGNSLKAMNETQFIPLFLGIALGVIVGLLPISFPGLPVPVRLGLAGGPLIVGILLSRLGHIGKLIWHVPHNANMAFRELGITLFLAAVGLAAGQRFFESAISPTGLRWVICAAATAMIPLLVVGVIARSALKMNYTTLSGLIAGSTTDPPALAFAGLLTHSDGPSVAYATVYPLTMLLRILAAQCLALLLCS